MNLGQLRIGARATTYAALAVGIIQIGPTVQKLFVETCFPIEMADLEIPAKHVR